MKISRLRVAFFIFNPKWLKSLWSRLTGNGSRQINVELDEALFRKVHAAQSAKDLREVLRQQAKSPDFVALELPKLLRELRALSWSALEIEKVLAYVDFFSGANAQGYHRVLKNSLARRDYALFMTACVHCYLADRFAEGVALLDMFQPHEDPFTDWAEYLAYAGYLNFAAGKRADLALKCLDQALEAGYFSPLLAVNAYPIYFEAGRLAHCEKLRVLIQKNCPHDPEAIYALAVVELARNYYPEGFRLMEARYRMPDLARFINISLLQKPRWDRQSLTKKRLLVHGEQGLGDMIMMARYLPLLHELGAELMIDGRVEASSLLTHNFPYCKFIVGDIQSPIIESFDYWIGIMSLPYCFNTTALDVPATNGYLSVPAEQAAYWRPRIRGLADGPKLRVGLTWSGNPGHRADKRRSMTFDLICSLVRRLPDIYFYSLQTHVPSGHPANLIDIADELLTMADTAAVISEMDLVISVDTSAIHLAGALGRPAWLLLPYRYEWRWGLEGDANPWYSSVRVWRQGQLGAWPELLSNVGDALQSFSNRKAGA